MKKIFILLLIIPMLGFTQNDLVFNQVRNITLVQGETATVPTGKAWKIESAYPPRIYVSHNADDDFGTSSDAFGGSSFAEIGNGANSTGNNVVWIKQGNTIGAAETRQSFSIIEFNVVAASSSSGSGSSSGPSGGGFSSSTPGDDFTDQSGNSFNSTNTGDLTWSTSNASNTIYRDGTPIPQITNEVDWNTATTGAWCYLHFDESNASYGKLYNWYAIVGKNDSDTNTPPKIFGPSGWHVPSFAEWNNLMITNSEQTTTETTVVSGAAISYWTGIGLSGKMKSQTNWTLGFNGTNSTGMNIKPYSFMTYGQDSPISGGWGSYQTPENYVYEDVGNMTVFWSKDRQNNIYAYSIAFGYEPGPYFAANTSGWSNDRIYNWSGWISDGSAGGIYGTTATNSGVNSAFYVRLVKDY